MSARLSIPSKPHAIVPLCQVEPASEPGLKACERMSVSSIFEDEWLQAALEEWEKWIKASPLFTRR